jgi:hypothetical protein
MMEANVNREFSLNSLSLQIDTRRARSPRYLAATAPGAALNLG